MRPPEDRTAEDDAAERSLAPAVRWVWAGQLGLVGVAAVAAALLGELLLPSGWLPRGLLTVVVTVVAVAGTVVWPPVRYRRWRYRIRPHDVHLRYGVLWHVERTVPRRRIQHVDVTGGPVEQLLDLRSVRLYTAGTREADARIPGLRREVAEAMRARLLAEQA